MSLKQWILSLSFVAFAPIAAPVAVAKACEGGGHGKTDGKASCDCAHGQEKASAAKTQAATKVSLEGTVVSYGCSMKAKKLGCTGAALVVGDTKHLIKKSAKGNELVAKTKNTEKMVKVTGSKKGDFLTVKTYEIKS